ncbi:hypothetical protein LPE509_02043 [Legionella pneumophila subsp. pneumophila LPE509]|nr:hypothetical protein LPE509_02043 [Legionella pneumophila subsp. pneumophila LPE509]
MASGDCELNTIPVGIIHTQLVYLENLSKIICNQIFIGTSKLFCFAQLRVLYNDQRESS